MGSRKARSSCTNIWKPQIMWWIDWHLIYLTPPTAFLGFKEMWLRLHDLSTQSRLTVARMSSIGGLYVRAEGGLTFKFHKIPLTTVFQISIWGLEALFGWGSVHKSPPGLLRAVQRFSFWLNGSLSCKPVHVDPNVWQQLRLETFLTTHRVTCLEHASGKCFKCGGAQYRVILVEHGISVIACTLHLQTWRSFRCVFESHIRSRN